MKAGKLKFSLSCWIALEVRTNIDARYKIGQTSLHGPVREGNPVIIDQEAELSQKGAKLEAKDVARCVVAAKANVAEGTGATDRIRERRELFIAGCVIHDA